MSNTIQAKDIYEIYKRFITADLCTIKTNLYHACRILYTRGTKDEFVNSLGFTKSVFDSMINKAHPARVTFENFIQLTGQLNLDIDKMLTKQEYPQKVKIVREKRKKQSKWTNELKHEFLKYLSENGVFETMTKYNMSRGLVATYKTIFNKERIESQ